MGLDYALVHLKYNVPPAIALTWLYLPLYTKLDVYKILFLITIAVLSTTPWDSYLIRRRIWSYPPNAILGPTLFSIPAEELFFFVIQTYNTSLLYLILNTATVHATYLKSSSCVRRVWQRNIAWIGSASIALLTTYGAILVSRQGEGLYLGLILIWAGPFIFLLWTLAYQVIMGLPSLNCSFVVILPTLYLWLVDTFALRRGTWVIENGTKLGWTLWEGLEVEEALFFLVTNTLIVFGLIAFDTALAILHTSPLAFPAVPELPSPVLLVKALVLSTSAYESDRINGLRDAVNRLKAKSRSFYLASGVFKGRLRLDLMFLYSFCRVADDLVDEAPSVAEAEHSIQKLKRFLDISYTKAKDIGSTSKTAFVYDNFSPTMQSALLLLPTTYLSSRPLYDLLEGFRMDLHFASNKDRFPIQDERQLELYGSRVAGTVAELCIELVYHHTTAHTAECIRQEITASGHQMGVALQYINISRDINVDASNWRVYLPTTWLKEMLCSPDEIIKDPSCAAAETLRQRLLDKAMDLYNEARGAIERLPPEACGPMRVAVESYVEIGRVLRTPGYKVKHGRATVSKLRRLKVARQCLMR